MPESIDSLYGESGKQRTAADDVGFFESALAGVATGLWNIPKEVFSFGAEIYDLVGDTNTAKEIEDWFDEVTVKRNIGSLKEAKGTFIESAKEMSKLQQRLEGAYEDIGQVLGRYYEIKEATDDYDGTNVDGYVKDNPHDDEDTNGNVPN